MTVTPVLEKRRPSGNTFPLIVRIRHGQRVKELWTQWKLSEKQFIGGQAVKHPDAAQINADLSKIISEVRNYFADCQRTGKPFRIELIGRQTKSYSFSDYLIHRASQYEKKEMLVMAAKTRRIAKELKQCFEREIFFDELSQDILRDYEAWLKGIGNTDNTRHKKFKFLQQFYSQGVLDGKASDPNPFKLYKIGTKPVRKEKLSLEEIKAIEGLQLKPGAVNDARNLFLFSYYSKGARFENCIMFKREQIVNDRLLFRANKGNKFISVKIHARLRSIIDFYTGELYLFPYVKEQPADKRSYIKLVDVSNVTVNRNLKIVAALAEIKPFTFHQARHTFAYHLKKVASNIAAIQDSLGHSSSRTTEIYLKELDDEYLDTEMEKVYGK